MALVQAIFPASVTDINLVIHSNLTIVDATRIMIANGPQGGRLSDESSG
ncbi:MAG: hypothetical protein PF441_11185 [Desulfuromusa sp.]|nr:hypothetical protein [Desulfuromusa sp.]